MLDYVSPSGVRILNPNNVRLGAHLAGGTVVMTAGTVSFNAGTVSEAMIEGRVSSGVVVGPRSDIGGGASLMGSLSGGNEVRVAIGEDCPIEAMAGLGIPVGDRVRIEAGFYVKSTTPVLVVDSPALRGNPIASPHLGATVKERPGSNARGVAGNCQEIRWPVPTVETLMSTSWTPSAPTFTAGMD